MQFIKLFTISRHGMVHVSFSLWMIFKVGDTAPGNGCRYHVLRKSCYCFLGSCTISPGIISDSKPARSEGFTLALYPSKLKVVGL